MTDAEKSAALRVFAASCQLLERIVKDHYPDLNHEQVCAYVRLAMREAYPRINIRDVTGLAISLIVLYPHVRDAKPTPDQWRPLQ